MVQHMRSHIVLQRLRFHMQPQEPLGSCKSNEKLHTPDITSADLSQQTDCSSNRAAIISVRDIELLSPLWQNAGQRATHHANCLEAKF